MSLFLRPERLERHRQVLAAAGGALRLAFDIPSADRIPHRTR